MLKHLVFHRCTFQFLFARSSLIIRSNSDLTNQIKSFNEKKQFKRSLELFDQEKNTNIKHLSLFTITQLLRACTEIGDIQRGLTIYNLLSPEMKVNSGIVLSLINLHGEFW